MSESREWTLAKGQAITSTLHEEEPAFALALGMTLAEVALLNRFCDQMRRLHLQLEGAMSEQQSQQLLQLFHRINNHIHPDNRSGIRLGGDDEQH